MPLCSFRISRSTGQTTTAETIFLSGVSNDATREAARGELYGRLGVMIGPQVVGPKANYDQHLQDYAAWGFDNNCFTNAGAFDERSWLRQLANLFHEIDGAHETCLFGVAPDVFDPVAMRGDALATIARSLPVLSKIRAIGAPAALVFQDGLENHADVIPWDSFDVAFLGGSDGFKLGYPSQRHNNLIRYAAAGGQLLDEKTEKWARLIEACAQNGKPVHVGRVNSELRFVWCRSIGAESCDGTFIARAGTSNGLRQVTNWLKG